MVFSMNLSLMSLNIVGTEWIFIVLEGKSEDEIKKEIKDSLN